MISIDSTKADIILSEHTKKYGQLSAEQHYYTKPIWKCLK